MCANSAPRFAECGRQNHLSQTAAVNFGAYYTAPEYVQIVRRMLNQFGLPQNAVILDSACGYGAFLRADESGKHKIIGCDIDSRAAAKAREQNPDASVFCANALQNVSRRKFNIAQDAPLVVVGNPPYNDRTSQIRRAVKTNKTKTDSDLQCRDLGISFMRSFDKLRADIVCVLHPLSYLVKRANFSLLGAFAENYVLRRAEILSSSNFYGNSQNIPFPVAVALYLRDSRGMWYEEICGFRFRAGRACFAVGDFQYLADFARKYPRQREQNDLKGIAFYPMRDINALRRNRTFIFGGDGGVFMNRAQLRYYIYADVFKNRARNVPYYFGNCDVMINAPLFHRYEKHFIADAVRRHPQLREYVSNCENGGGKADEKITEYFRQLLGEHYSPPCQ